ncbi:sensor histidine kinase [Pseudodesulfovibrio sediminis]|uniref:histidine kinase n=1 Tax=Pseudodesulfovibrio sediminis TaxID=2810563 RepID=A0ABN6EWR3_9BACT|nr:PAS domain-containing sensor histidine kinase [Pseudodesulfovibrio sediminis]BCS89586.1 hypothetical protein PSDVSF_28280 [Pseudodesulfovibrio sediminis]
MVVILVLIRVLLLVSAFCLLVYVGRKEHVRRASGWIWVILGFGAVALGSLLQLGMNVPALQEYILFSDLETNNLFAEIFGYSLGICFVLMGVWKLAPTLYKFYVSEQKLKASEQRLQAIVNSSIQGIVIVQGGNIVFTNPSMEKMFNCTKEDLIGARAIDFIVKADQDRVYARRDAILAQKKDKSIGKYKLLTKDGDIRSALISAQYIKWDGEDAFLSIISDVTELEQIEESLSAIVNTATEAIGIFQDEHLVYCNPIMISMFGYSFEELQSIPFYDFVHPEDREMLYRRYGDRQAGKDVPNQYDCRLLTRDGTLVWVMISAGIMNWKGRVATITILTNVTERKKHEEEIRLAKKNLEARVEERTRNLSEINEQLMEINNQKSAFVSAASHEVRTPLASILGFAILVNKTLKKTVVPAVEEDAEVLAKVERAIGNLDIVKEEGERLTRLLDGILDISEIEAGRMEWRDESLLILPLVEVAMAEAKLQLSPGVSMQVKADSIAYRVFADLDRITQVVTNLLDNAVKFTNEGEIIVSICEKETDVLEIRVSDTGIGMTSEERQLVFQKYYQADSCFKGISMASKGAGLGLAISKEIVEYYGGEIGVEPGPGGVGSSFYFTLPLLRTE